MSSKPTPHTPRGSQLAWALACATLLVPATALAQSMMRPASRPAVTAENERWYQAGQAITFSGGVYDPAGPPIFFDANQMVPSGSFRGIPLFVVSTREPFSVVYVPTADGLMRPYQRRWDEEAGTTGTPVLDAAFDAAPLSEEYPTGPSASLSSSRNPAAARPAGPLTTALKPTGLNAFYIEYNGKRWYSAGPVVDLDPAAFSPAGEYHGFPVYTAREDAEMIFIPVATDVPGLLAQYSTRR